MLPTPLFSHPDTASQAHRRLLLISYHFPPRATIGGRRWEQLAQFVAERGWGLDVIMAHDPAIPVAHEPRMQRLPFGIRIWGVAEQTFGIEKAESWVAAQVRALRSGPQGSKTDAGGDTSSPAPAVSSDDGWRNAEELRWGLGSPRGWFRMHWTRIELARYRAWNRNVIALARRILQKDVHGAIVVSGPPHGTFDAGRILSRKTGIPFIMDMRDPWSQADRVPEPMATPYYLRAARRDERRAVAQASLVAANTDIARNLLRAAYPEKAQDIVTVMNGADENPVPESRRMERFAIGHAGTIYRERDPRLLFAVAARFIQERQLTPEQFGLDFIGFPEGKGAFSLRALAQEAGIASYVTVGGAVPHQEALEFMARSAMLLVMSGLDLAIPGKLFEYIRFRAWLLAMAPQASALGMALAGSEADVVPPEDSEAMLQVIRQRYDEHQQGMTPPLISADGRFSRRGQAKTLLDAIERIQGGMVNVQRTSRTHDVSRLENPA